VAETPRLQWDIVINVAVDTAEETEAHSIVGRLLDTMGVSSDGPPVFTRYEDGIWVAEIHTSGYEEVEPSDVLSVLSCLTVNLGTLTWVNATDRPDDPDSALAGLMEWPPGYFALAGRRETLLHPSVRAVMLRGRRRDAA
jgi:hypothetical protein